MFNVNMPFTVVHNLRTTVFHGLSPGGLIVVLVRYQKYQSIAILAKVRYRYLVVSRYFDMFGIERPLFDTFDISILDTESESIRRSRCEGATSLLVTTLFTGAITTALRSLN